MKPRLSLCMIVRDEEDLLPACLDSVAGVADEVVVVDTGSVDRTPEIARSRGARVVEHPWTGDFAAARNAGLERAQGEWVLVMDADEVLHPEDRAQVPGLLIMRNVEGYLNTQVNFVGEDVDGEVEMGFSMRLFRNRAQYRYRGRIHERVDVPSEDVRMTSLRILHYGYLRSMVGDRNKRSRNMELLEQAVAEQPDDMMMYYYLGNEYLARDRNEEAVTAYRLVKAAALEGGYLYAAKLIKNLAHGLLRLDRPEEALAELNEGLVHFPEFTDLVYMQGSIYRALGRLPEAIGCFHQCLAMGPAKSPPLHGVNPALGSWKAAHSLGLCHEARGEWAKAADFYRRAWQAGHKQPPLQSLARLLVIHRGPDAAEAELAALVQPTDTSAHLALAEALAAAHHWRAALRQLEPAASAPRFEGRPEAGSLLLSPPWSVPDRRARDEERIRRIRAICRFHLGRFAAADEAFASLSPDVYPRERTVTALAAGRRRPAELLAEEGLLGARQAAAGLFSAAVSTLEQGLLRRPESKALQDALKRAMEEAKRLG